MLLLLLGLLLVGGLTWRLLISPQAVIRALIAQGVPMLEAQTGLLWEYNPQSVTVFGNTITLQQVRLLLPEDRTPVAEVDRLVIRLRWRSLIQRDPLTGSAEVARSLRGVTLDGLQVHVRRTDAGFDLVEHLRQRPRTGPTQPLTASISIRGATLHYTDFPLLPDGSRDWTTPLSFAVGWQADGRLQQGVLTNSVLRVTPVSARDDVLLLATGGADFQQGYSFTLSPDVSVADLGREGWLGPLLQVLGPSAESYGAMFTGGSLTGQVLAVGDVSGGLPETAGDLRVRNLVVRHALLGAEEAQVALDVTLQPGKWRITHGTLHYGSRELAFLGAVDPTSGDWPVDLRFTAMGFELPEIPVPLPFAESIGYHGPLTAAGQVQGPIGDPEIVATVLGPRVLLAGQPFELLPSTVRYRRQILRLQATARSAGRQLLVAGSADLAGQTSGFQIEARELEAMLVRKALPAFSTVPLEGPLNAAITILNSPGEPTRTDIQLASRQGTFAGAPYGAMLGKLRLAGEAVDIQRVMLTLPDGAPGAIHAQGTWTPGGDLQLHAEWGGLDLARYLPGGYLRGEGFGRLDLRGTDIAPEGDFTLQVLDGSLGSFPFQRLRQTGRLSESRLELTDGTLVLERGNVSLHGVIDLAATEQVSLQLDCSQLGGLSFGPVDVRSVSGELTLRGPLTNLKLEQRVHGEIEVAGLECTATAAHPLELTLSQMGIQTAMTPMSWLGLYDQWSRVAPTIRQDWVLSHQGAIHVAPTGMNTTFDPHLSAAIRKAAPTLGHLMLEADEESADVLPVTGDVILAGGWEGRNGVALGETSLTSELLQIGPTRLTQVTGRLGREEPGPLQVALRGSREESAFSVEGTLTPAAILGESPLDLHLALDHWPLSTVVALTAPGIAPQIDGLLTGGGRLQGPLAALETTPATAGAPGHLHFALHDGRLGELRDITGDLVMALREGEFRLHELALTGAEDFRVRGQGTIYLASDRFSDSRAVFNMSGLPLERLRPLFGENPPEMSGLLECSAQYASLNGIPGIQGLLSIQAPRIGLLQLDRLQALLLYNPFTRRLTIERERPLFVEKQSYRLLMHGRVDFPEDQSPQLSLELETPASQAMLPVAAVIKPNEYYSAQGGMESLFLRVRGTLLQPRLYGDAEISLSDIRWLGQPVLAKAEGTLHFDEQVLLLEDRQFWIENSDGGKTGRLALEGRLDLGALLGAQATRELGAVRLRPASPGAVLPLTGFGLHAGLMVPEPGAPGAGRPLGLRLSGEELLLTGDIALGSGSVDIGGLTRLAATPANLASREGVAGSSATRVPGPMVSFDVGMSIPEGFQVTGPTGLKMTLAAGRVQVTGNLLTPSIVGTISARSGSLGVLGKEFRLVEPAVLTFNSLYGLDPLIQARAETRVDTTDPSSLGGRRTVIITVTVNAQFQDLGESNTPGLSFSSNDPQYGTASQILALLAGFGGDRPQLAGVDDPLGERLLKGLGNAAVSIPGQVVGQFFEEEGFRRFLIGTNVDGDLFIDAEYELYKQFSVDYRQEFGVDRDWEAGVRYEFRNNSYFRLGTNEDYDFIAALEYRIPLGTRQVKASRREIAEEEAALAAREADRDAAAQAPVDPAGVRDDNATIEELPGAPEVISEAREQTERHLEEIQEQE